MNDPEFNYVYKASAAHTMAKYVDFGFGIGYGENFSLPNYYKLCDQIVTALKLHESLLEKHFDRLNPEHYYDQSLHMLAFDLMYCCQAYGFYKGLTVPSTGKTIRKKNSSGPSQEELAQKEKERQERISEIEQEMAELTATCDIQWDIDLIGVQVTSPMYGVGTVIGHNFNKIKVRFDDCEKSFVLDNKHTSRPRFDDDKEIVDLFSEIAAATEKLKKLQKELITLQG